MEEFSYKLVSSDKELKSAFEVRRRVFVEEQGISKALELDEYDREALHMVVKDKERVIGTARIRFLVTDKAKLERMAVLKHFRRRSIGRGIISFLIEELRKRQVKQLLLHAQYSVAAFYRSCGLEESGLPFWEAGIKHIKMQRRI